MNNWIDICLVTDIPVLGARTARLSGTKIAIFRTRDDQVFALEDSCPHKQGPLSQGIVHGHRVTCPLHEWVFELESGEAMAPDVGCTRRFPTRVTDGMVAIDLDIEDSAQAAAE